MAGDEPVRILVVCTANQCRSPLTAASLERHAHDAGRLVEVVSAGIQAVDGLPATAPTIKAARKVGLDLSAHASAPLDAEEIAAADLVIGLERRHVQEIVLEQPASFPKTYTLKELVRRGTATGPRRPGESVAEWLATVHEGRRPMDLLGASLDDDVEDPTGSGAVDHHTTASEVDALAASTITLLFG